MLNKQRTHKHDVKTALKGFFYLVFAVASFLLVSEIGIFAMRFARVILGGGAPS